MDSEDDMHSTSEAGSLDDYYSDEGTAIESNDDGGYSDGGDNEVDYSDDSINPTSHCQQSYTVLGEEAIRQSLEKEIMRISDELFIPKASASVLLSYYDWNVEKLQGDWFTDEEKVRTTVGLLDNPIVDYSNSKELTCRICYEDFCRDMMHGASCGHLFCSSCLRGYISTSIEDGPRCLTLRCPDPLCGAAVDQEILNMLVSDEVKEKYSRCLLRSYVESSKNTKWCPAPGCDYAIGLVVGSENNNVLCNCTYNFCWNCTEESHRPADCDTVAKWILKNSADAENTNWMLANSKPCPKCKRAIEKNQGCMHMTCSVCRCEFCWLCLGSWEEHGGETGGYNSCNRFNKLKKEGELEESEKRREMAKKMIEKYIHYYERWAANESSKQKAMKDFKQTRDVHIEKLRNKYCELLAQLDFITEAWLQIIECRRVLKWTYAYGYYLPEHEHKKRQLFEYLQGEAESGLERLHQCAEKDLEMVLNDDDSSNDFNLFRIKLAGLTSVTRNYFDNLVQALENGLSDVDLCCSGSMIIGEEEDVEDMFGLRSMFEMT